ncbi:MAG: ATP-dependent DNA helicase DinG [Hyphomicrobiaceae bacterium]
MPVSALSAPPAALQEDLPLAPKDRFVYEISLADLGLGETEIATLVEAGPLCFLDFEATGLDMAADTLIEAGAVRIDPGASTAQIFNSLIRTELQLTPFIKRLTGIAQEDLVDAPEAMEVSPALNAFIGDAAVVAHNAAFERAWLERAVEPRFRDHAYLDTVELLALVYPDSPNMKLDTFCRRALGRQERHRALDDALDTLRLVANILEESRDGSPSAANALECMRAFAPRSPWIARLAGLSGSASTAVAPRGPGASVSGPSLAPVAFDADAIAKRLSDDDHVVDVVPGFASRTGQIEMARRVHGCLAGSKGKTVVLCEAGTGIGKTLAYLAAAIPFAVKTGEQVIISTSSKMLQTQLLEKDIPAAARMLGYPDLRFAVMKGRGNYVCRRRLDAFLDTKRSEGKGDFATALLAAFAESTGHGEVDRIPSVLFQLNPELERHTREVTSGDATECSRSACEKTAGHCVFREARRRLEGAEIAVVNHDLLLRWPPDYPPLRHLILDEIHELVERADGAYARTANAVEIVHRLEGLLGRRGGEGASDDDRVRNAAEQALTFAAAVGEEGRRVARSGNSNPSFQFSRDEMLVPWDGPGPEWKELIDQGLGLATALSEITGNIRASDEESRLGRTCEVFEEAVRVLEGALPQPSTDMFVYRMRGLSRPSTISWRLVATPVLPADDFRVRVLEQAESVFGTTATLSAGGDGSGAVRELRLEEGAAGRLEVAPAIPSPFDYKRNLEVLFLADTTDPSQLVENTARAIVTTAKGLGGRTLGLFTSRDRMVRVANAIEPLLAAEGITVIAPTTGNADPHDLVRTFIASDRAVLLGARSFWQGVDIAGDSCQAVVIEKLPFDVPGDPLLERRAEVLFGSGRRAFHEYNIPRMLLRLKQMMGRLIRTPHDRGIIVLVESRADKPYFRRLRDAVPPAAETHLIPASDLERVVEDFVRRQPSDESGHQSSNQSLTD